VRTARFRVAPPSNRLAQLGERTQIDPVHGNPGYAEFLGSASINLGVRSGRVGSEFQEKRSESMNAQTVSPLRLAAKPSFL
jgi:hypothetical protein